MNANAILPTIRMGYLSWPVLMAGVIMLLRASGRGHRYWEPFALVVVASTPPVLMCLTFYFHPQDLMAMGLIVAGVASFLRKRWLLAGIVVALAFSSQQFALLVGAPLMIVAPRQARMRFVTGIIVVAALIDVPLIVATSGRAVKTVLLGSSRVGETLRSTGGTVLWETHMRGIPLFLVTRVLPVALSIAITWWASRRLGSQLLSPIPLISLLATSLTMRLAFEENLFGYYFMAVAVALIMLDVAAGRIRGPVVAWLALVTLAFNPVHLGFVSNLTSWSLNLSYAIPITLFSIAVLCLAVSVVRRRTQWYAAIWIVFVALTCESKIWGAERSLFVLPNWLWQVILVPIALALALGPLLRLLPVRASNEMELVSHT